MTDWPTHTEDGRPLVELPEQWTGGLVIEAPTGIVYTTQVGGTCCAHPQAEGFLVPLSYPEWAALEKATLSRYEESGSDHYRSPPASLARLVAEAIWSTDEHLKIALDTERLTKEPGTVWAEAWLPITCVYGRGWLTWDNSD